MFSRLAALAQRQTARAHVVIHNYLLFLCSAFSLFFHLRTQGFCGSYTTYSGWNLRIARAALGQIPGAPSGAIVAIVAIVTSLAFFSACFAAGSDLMKEITSRGRRLRLGMLGGGGGLGGGGSDAVRAALGMLGGVYVLLAILLAVDPNWSRRIDWVACMFAPFGALLRFFLSRCGFVSTLPQPFSKTLASGHDRPPKQNQPKPPLCFFTTHPQATQQPMSRGSFPPGHLRG